MQHNYFKNVTFLVLSLCVFGLNSFAQPNCSAVIHAISINPGNCNGGVDCDSPSEYVEIFNPCFEPLELGCSAICQGSWCVTIPSGTVLMPGEYLSVGSATSPGFEAANAAHLDMNNCSSCAWLNPAGEAVELGALADDKGQVALFDAAAELLQGLVWGDGQPPGQSEFPVDMMIEETNGCAAKTLTLPNPASNEKFAALTEVEGAGTCSFSIKANNAVTKICESEGGNIAMGAANLFFSPFTIDGCLYTGDTINLTLNIEGEPSSIFWTIPCGNNFLDPLKPTRNIFCDQPGVKTITVLVVNQLNGYTYQYKEDIEILPDLELEEVEALQNQEVCLGEDVSFEIPIIEGLDSQVVVVNSPPNEPQILTDIFTVDIQNIEETSTIVFTGFSSGTSCEITKEMTITVLPDDEVYCGTPVAEYFLLSGSVYPNPAKNFVQIQYELKQNAESNLNLYNASGQKVYQQTLLSYAGKNQQNIDIEKMPDGVYMLSLTLQNKTAYFKFIKE